MRQHRHFTIVEMLVAMTVFIIIMMVLTVMLSDAMKLSRKRRQKADLLQKQQILGAILSADLKGVVVNAQNPFQFTSSTASFVTTSSIGVDLDNTSATCPLNRVSYGTDGKDLYRGIEQCLSMNDPLPWSWTPIKSEIIAENVKELVIDARLANGDVVTGDSMPDLVTMVVTFVDERDSDDDDTATQKYVKRVFIDRGNSQ